MQVINIPPTTGKKPTGLIVVLHGWGANAKDLASVVPFLNLPDYQFILPDAPFNHPHVAGGKAWYDLQTKNNQGYFESKQLLNDWLQSLEKETGIPLSQTILSGFSQGAAMTLDVGLHLPLAGLVALSGYLHPVTETNSAIPPILLVHGRQDSVVPLSAAQKARDSLLAMGAKVQYQEFDMGHEIRPEVIALIRNFIVAQQK